MTPRQSTALQAKSLASVDAVAAKEKAAESEENVRGATDYFSKADDYRGMTQMARAVIVLGLAAIVHYRSSIQVYVDDLWDYLVDKPWFYTAYFETVYVTIVYSLLLITYPFAMHHIPFLRRFKVSADVTYVHRDITGKRGMGLELLTHMLPLLVADALKMKKYRGVPESEWAWRKQHWIQTTRALPLESPNVLVLIFHVFLSVIVFDLLFFGVHFLMHKNLFLYRHFHSQHHDHDVMHPHVTNQLSVVERGLQVASANTPLLLFGCHPLTRLMFVPVFLWFLIENHTGYDLPWAPHRLLPSGLMGGPGKHHAHHIQGSRHYQPFFNYLDNWLEQRQARKKSQSQSSL